VPAYDTLGDLLSDDSVDLVVNLTNPESHFEVSSACLGAGKHVYSEKPLAMDFLQAKELCFEARQRGLKVASAPCGLLGETAQTMWKALRSGKIGQVYLVYAALDGGLKHRHDYRMWRSRSGAYWPAINEFETGCTIEHAGYALTWLLAFFGPVRRVSSYAACLVQDKATDRPLRFNAPDFSSGCVEFESGVVARVTNSIVAREDHSLVIFGEEGTIRTRNIWDYASPVYIEPHFGVADGFSGRVRRKIRRVVENAGLPSWWFGQRIPLVRTPGFERPLDGHPMDFMRGVAELAESIDHDRPCRLSPELALLVTEITLTLQRPDEMGRPRMIETGLPAIEPMPWGL
jgi:predicted dehydrogenase